MPKEFPPRKRIKWELPRIEGEPLVTCEICGGEGIAAEIQIFHRGCRLSEAFPHAYDKKDGMLIFDHLEMRQQLNELRSSEPNEA